jgi:Cys-tRNA(Pro)/Cys-tRNA(Cys) deacylase
MSLSTPATRQLDLLGIPYQVHVHAGPLHSLEQAARERGLVADQIVRSLLFRLESGEFALVLMPGVRQVAWPKLRQHLGVSRITTASREQVLAATGYPPGAVTPFGLPRPLRILADPGILVHERLSLGAGAPNAGLILARDDLLAVVQPVIVPLTDQPPPDR